jgi:uncharacterized membrane protein
MTDAFDRAVERVDAENRRRNRIQARERLGTANRFAFRIHATAFVAVQVMLFVIWLLVWLFAHGTAHPWFVYPLLGWGVGLVVHYSVASRLWRGIAEGTKEQPA